MSTSDYNSYWLRPYKLAYKNLTEVIPLYYFVIFFVLLYLLYFVISSLDIKEYIIYIFPEGSSPNLSSNGEPSSILPSGPNNNPKMLISYVLNTDTDNLADWLSQGNHFNRRLKDIGLTTNVHQAVANDTVYYSKVFRYIGDHCGISTNTSRKASQAFIDSIRALKVNMD